MRATQAPIDQTTGRADEEPPTLPPFGQHAGYVQIMIDGGDVWLKIRVGANEKPYEANIILNENDIVRLLEDLRKYKSSRSNDT